MRPWLVVGFLIACGTPRERTQAVAHELALGPERELDGVELGPAAMFQQEGAVAFDGEHYLALWDDYRWNLYPSVTRNSRDLYGTRMTPGRVFPRPAGTMFWSTTSENVVDVAAACDGAGGCLAISSIDFNVDGWMELTGHRIAAGAPTGAPFSVAVGPNLPFQRYDLTPNIAWDGAGYRVVYAGFSGDQRVVTTLRVLADGTVTPEATLATGSSPELACGAASCLAVWYSGQLGDGQLMGQRLDANGAVGSVFPITSVASSTSGEHAAVGWAGSVYWAVWGSTGRLVGARVSASGTVLDATPKELFRDPIEEVAIAFDGRDAIATWNAGDAVWRQLRATRLTTTGTVRDAQGFVLATGLEGESDTDVDIACTTGNCLVQMPRGGRDENGRSALDIIGIRIANGDGAPVVLDPMPQLLSQAAPAQIASAVDGEAGRYVAVWQETQSSSGLRGAYFTSTAGATSAFEIPTEAYGGEASRLRVALGPTTAMVARELSATVETRVFDAAGQPGSAIRTTPPNNVHGLEVAATADGFIFASVANFVLTTRAFDAAGAPRGDAIRLATVTSSDAVDVAFDGTNALVVWPYAHVQAIMARRVSPAGVPIDVEVALTNAAPALEDVSVACAQGSCLVAAAGIQPGTQVIAVRVRTDVTPMIVDPPIAIGVGRRVDVAFDGTGYIVTWEVPEAQRQLRRVALDGTLGEVFDISAVAEGPSARVAGDDNGHAIVAYARFDDGPEIGAWRVKVRDLDVAITPDGAPDAAVPDAATPDAAVPDAPPDAPAPPSDGGCSATGMPGAGLLVLGAFLRRRRRLR